MIPSYINELRYSYTVDSSSQTGNLEYLKNDEERSFEAHFHHLFMDGQAQLRNGRFTAAQDAFQEATALIIRTLVPDLPVDRNQIKDFPFPRVPELLDPLIEKTVEILQKTLPPRYEFPRTLIGTTGSLPTTIGDLLAPLLEDGVKITSFHQAVHRDITNALDAAGKDDWQKALDRYNAAFDLVPSSEKLLRASLRHDMAVISDILGRPVDAAVLAKEAIAGFGAANLPGGEAQAIAATAGILLRNDQPGEAAGYLEQLQSLQTRKVLNDILPAGFHPADAAARHTSLEPKFPGLLGLSFLDAGTPERALTLRGEVSSKTIDLREHAAESSFRAFLQDLATTEDVAILSTWSTPEQTIAHLPRIYYFVLPMLMADCYRGMGEIDKAISSYEVALEAPYLNEGAETVRIWTRLAESYLELGDQAYRAAKNDVQRFDQAKAFYEKIVLSDKSLDLSSPLYHPDEFKLIQQRVVVILATDDPSELHENREIVLTVLRALGRLQQINAGLNFLGISLDYLPPFSFEHLLNSARHFAERAMFTEQQFLHFKQNAEDENFRHRQLTHQTEVADLLSELEVYNVKEAMAGVQTAQKGYDYATAQHQAAIRARDDFNKNAWDIVKHQHMQAWASAMTKDNFEINPSWNSLYSKKGLEANHRRNGGTKRGATIL